MRIGIMSAMPEENNQFTQQAAFTHRCTVSRAQRIFTTLCFNDHEITTVFSRCGKVAAAITATHLLTEFKVDIIVFTGVAASCSSSIKRGDIVIADNLVQHDMDARPIFSQYEIPLTGIKYFKMNSEWKNNTYEATRNFLKETSLSSKQALLSSFGISNPRIFQGQIASGDKFFASENELMNLKTQLPDTLCVEMEGAAVAQVCEEYEIPCVVIRTISDSGNENSPEEFQQFLSSIASYYSLGILNNFLEII